VKKRLTIIGFSCAACLIILAVVAGSAARRHAALVNCGNQMHSILLVSTMLWPDEHDGRLPSNFISMSNELATPKILICPGDRSRKPAADWAVFGPEHCSYQIVAPGVKKSETNTVFLRCPIHGYAGYVDDRLFDSSARLVRPQRIW
jgi:hypothetical protein